MFNWLKIIETNTYLSNYIITYVCVYICVFKIKLLSFLFAVKWNLYAIYNKGIPKADAYTHFRVVLHITITQKRDVVVRRVRFAPSVKSSNVKYVSGVLFFTRSVFLEGNRRIEKWKKIRQGENRKHEEFERGWSFHNSSESSSLLQCFPLCRCLHSPFPRFCTNLLFSWFRVDGREIRCLSH